MKEKTLILCLIIGFFNISLTAQEVDKTLWEKALKIHQDVLVIDAHAHGLISRRDKDTGNKRDTSQVDLFLMKQGGIDAIFFSLPIEDNPDEKISKRVSRSADFVRDQLKKHADLAELALSSDDILRIQDSGKRAVLFSLEYFRGFLEGSSATIELYFKQGVRMITLTHTRADRIADSDSDDPGESGLSAFGREVVREMNRLGMVIDITHLPDQLQRDVIKESKGPVVASHSNTRSLVNISRNIPDDILKRIAEKGGAVMVTFDSGMLSSDYHPPSKERAPIGILIDHIDHVAKLIGIDHVGIGSDFMGRGLTVRKVWKRQQRSVERTPDSSGIVHLPSHGKGLWLTVYLRFSHLQDRKDLLKAACRHSIYPQAGIQLRPIQQLFVLSDSRLI